ncbi:endonuclease III [Desulfonatronospira thiodismutans ASO3-1]|uniref:Endonuclease III n=1 Tax=Desulfonatronospira thiodismutans ASO3-1 TaxID=555779 RepID=D6SM25_9BACT|nr:MULTISPECIES: endonuclease III [Desulfonatronospira]EFI35736.1 endonuclease III [Desulfonatronospira thiodismutans ASO3-1]RQD73570.1 MAG: endonuclease III [Desulfonatronospira sp. MSAO_Bac3]
MKKTRIFLPREVVKRLRKSYPAPATALKWQSPWELLVATILSAQCTDVQVNKITPGLFSRWPDPKSLSMADPQEVQEVIRPAGFFRTKSRNIIQAGEIINRRFQGRVPADMEDLMSLPGVASKTANIVLYGAYGINAGVAVDTHVKRTARRLGLTRSQDPGKIEKDLMSQFEQDDWGDLNHMLVLLGRETCRARKPLCGECPLFEICPKFISI